LVAESQGTPEQAVALGEKVANDLLSQGAKAFIVKAAKAE